MRDIPKSLLAVALSIQLPFAAAKDAFPYGIAFPGEGVRSCGPLDDPALHITFKGSGEALLAVHITVPASKAVGRWKLNSSDGPGGMAVHLCPHGYQAQCIAAKHAEVLVSSIKKAGIYGVWDIQFPSGERFQGIFRASMNAAPYPMCG